MKSFKTGGQKQQQAGNRERERGKFGEDWEKGAGDRWEGSKNKYRNRTKKVKKG